VVLGLIGAGGRGRSLARTLTRDKNVQFKYVCDVEGGRASSGGRDLEKTQGRRPKQVVDMRELFDDKDVHGVVVATPEHWHALGTVWACQAGKDVYVEKNISLTIWEGRKMVEAARKYKRIVQAGVQNRSAPYAFSARDYIRKGGLGQILYAKVFCMLPRTYGGSPFRHPPDSKPPAGLDWDRWLGPAPEVPYNRGRHRNCYGYWEYSGGSLAGDASHTLDLARMVLGDPPHPKAVHCTGGRFRHDGRGNIPEVQILSYEFDKFVMSCESTGFTPYIIKSPGSVRYADKFPFWPQNSSRIEIYGTRRMMYLGRHGGGWQVLERGGKVAAHEYGYHPDKWHLPNFVECIRTRKRPHGDIEQAHLGACLVHLGNVAYRMGNQKLAFGGETETFHDNDEANKYLKPAYRKHYRLPEKV
jgi:predicted dehydrogenase